MARSPAIPLAEGVWRIPTTPFDAVNSYALVDDDGSVTLIDCGVKSAPARIVAGLASLGKHPRDVTRILLTHAHLDHAGGAAAMVELTGAQLQVHEDDREFLESGRPPLSPPERRAAHLLSRAKSSRFTPVKGVGTVTDGTMLPVAGGLRVIHTPGHTPGHASLLHERSGVLITGDSLFNLLRLAWSPGFLCSDPEQNRRTATRLADLAFTTAAFTHGPEIRGTGREAVRGFLLHRS